MPISPRPLPDIPAETLARLDAFVAAILDPALPRPVDGLPGCPNDCGSSTAFTSEEGMTVGVFHPCGCRFALPR